MKPSFFDQESFLYQSHFLSINRIINSRRPDYGIFEFTTDTLEVIFIKKKKNQIPNVSLFSCYACTHPNKQENKC